MVENATWFLSYWSEVEASQLGRHFWMLVDTTWCFAEWYNRLVAVKPTTPNSLWKKKVQVDQGRPVGSICFLHVKKKWFRKKDLRILRLPGKKNGCHLKLPDVWKSFFLRKEKPSELEVLVRRKSLRPFLRWLVFSGWKPPTSCSFFFAWLRNFGEIFFGGREVDVSFSWSLDPTGCWKYDTTEMGCKRDLRVGESKGLLWSTWHFVVF